MSANASLTIVGGPQRIEPGRETTLTAQIVNLGTVPDDFRLSVREIDPGWVTFRPPTVFLQPGDRATAAIVIAPPVGIPAGSLRPIFRLLSRRAGNVAIVEIAMPTARATAPPPYQPPYQPPAQQQTPPPPFVRQPPPQTPPPAAETTRPIPRSAEQATVLEEGSAAEVATTEVAQQPRDVTPQRQERRQAGPLVEQPRRRSRSSIILGVGSLAIVLLLIATGIALSRRVGTVEKVEPTPAVDLAATEAPPVSTATTIIAAPATTPATATAVFVAKTFIVANTGGEGVYLRRTTNLNDRDTAYEDGTQLVQVGPDVQANGTTWRYVRVRDGKIGYIPAQYTQQAP
ncbi:MAG TPA: hypothetical protein VIL85_18105 [Thermomicrobiales bacterium]|jgi:hypothetical protein